MVETGGPLAVDDGLEGSRSCPQGPEGDKPHRWRQRETKRDRPAGTGGSEYWAPLKARAQVGAGVRLKGRPDGGAPGSEEGVESKGGPEGPGESYDSCSSSATSS